MKHIKQAADQVSLVLNFWVLQNFLRGNMYQSEIQCIADVNAFSPHYQ